jgi:hypothetical protein
LISVSVMCGRFFESPSSFGLGPTKRGIPGAVGKEALLMRENKAQGHSSEKRSRCEINHLFDGASCVEAAKEKVDGLLLCERHALEAKLEGQIECWGEMLFHIDLWSREAVRRDRKDVVGLLKVQRAQATSARHRAHEDLDVLRRSETSTGAEMPSGGRTEVVKRGSLPLPPRGARPLSRGLGRLRRR